jgi:hypothetical protein
MAAMSPTPQDTAPRGVDYVRLDQVQLAKRNPKGHAGEAIARSIAHHGFGELPLRDERTGRLVAGHGRYEQLVAMQAAGEDPPDGITLDEDGMWQMPVITGWASRSDVDAETYLIGSNEITTLGGWDAEGLVAVLDDVHKAGLLDLTGINSDRFREMADKLHEPGPPDDFPGYGDDIETSYQCPMCGYQWSGRPKQDGDDGA